MFKKAVFYFKDPICLCLEQDLLWNVVQTKEGPQLLVTCNGCGVRVQIPPRQFLGTMAFENPYPGKPKKKPVIEVQTPRPGDVIDISEYLRRRKEGLPS